MEHWPAAYFPEAGIPIVRGWYRQNDFPANELLYDEQVGPRAYQEWLRSLGVRYVVLAAAPADYSARAEAALLRSGEQLKEVAGRNLEIDDPGRRLTLTVQPERFAEAQLVAVKVQRTIQVGYAKRDVTDSRDHWFSSCRT